MTTTSRTLRRVVVTGAAGFIGTHLVQALAEREITVIAVDRKPPEPDAPMFPGPVIRITADLSDCALEPLFVDADTIFHLAGQPGVRTSWASGFDHCTTDNLQVTHRIAETATRLGVPRLILASSSSVYGPTNGTPSRESDPLNPISPYAISKLAAEQLCRAHCRKLGCLTESVALRYFTVYGPGQRRDMLIQRALSAAVTGEPIRVFGTGEQRRDFTYVADTVAATIAAASSAAPPPAVNVGSGRAISIADLFSAIGEVTGMQVPTASAPVEQGDVEATLADTALAANSLGWRAQHTLTDGLSEQWASLRRLAVALG